LHGNKEVVMGRLKHSLRLARERVRKKRGD